MTTFSYLITLIAVLMVAESILTLLNFMNLQGIIRKVLPQVNVKQVAIVELVAGLLILLSQIVGHRL